MGIHFPWCHYRTGGYYFDLKEVTSIELQVDPDQHDKQVFATPESVQIG
jgi:hypothetical protein